MTNILDIRTPASALPPHKHTHKIRRRMRKHSSDR